MYLFKTPQILKFCYPDLIWNKNRTERCIYLTFDDGPIPIVTPFVLKNLAQYQAKATFFCIGDNVDKHPDVFEQVQEAGHRIGNHTYSHLKGWDTDDSQYIDNFNKCAALTSDTLFRPPYGRARKAQIKQLKKENPALEIIMWDVLSGDFDPKLSPEQCLQKVLKHTQSGSIIVFHDSLKAFARLEYALPRVLVHFAEQGYEFRAL